ncbi:MAG: zinc ribbon domain-containing protein [Acidobacteriota bacterium]|nr:zinc ribbon domain-containing protein [Acidobacteriota bacterium]
MFCPKCGQSQPSDALRFCSRCGFALVGVAELLARDGVPSYPAAAVGSQSDSPRRRGMRQGVGIMLVGVFLIPIIALLHPLINLPGEYSVVGAIVFLAGLLRLLVAAIFESNTPKAAYPAPLYAPPSAQPQFDPRAPARPLPQADFHPAQVRLPRRQDTAEIVRPPASVTYHTTRLLADSDDSAGR